MTAVESLNSYLRRIEIRVRLFAASRGAAIVGGSALFLTLTFIWVANRFEFAQPLILPLRVLLFLTIAVALSLGLLLPLLRRNRYWVTRFAERRIPDFQERLLTFSERRDSANPFIELVAQDTLRIATAHQPQEFAPSNSFGGFMAFTVITFGVLLWMITAGPSYWGYGASLLWTGAAHTGTLPLYDIAVQPGNKTVRRNSDQIITAQLLGFSAKAILHVRYRAAAKWEAVPMQPERNGNGYEFLFAGLSDSVDYFVEAGARESKQYSLAVKDLPVVKRVRVTVHFPAQLGLKDAVEDPGGDVRAVEGSRADISVLTDRPLDRGVLVLNNSQKIELGRTDRDWLNAEMHIERDGSYYIAALDGGETVRISDDYFIEAKKDEPPSVKILRPGRDSHVSPIEEVPVTVQATDDFGIESLELHYSVNGGAEQIIPLLKTKRVKEAQGETTLYLEDFKLVPGDLISFYATARDASKTSRTSITFAQAEPFDYKFLQLQQMSSNGTMGGENDRISERQKQLIAATWNEIKDAPGEKTKAAEDARFLAGMETKLGDQAKTLAERMGNRDLVGTSSEFEGFSKAMQAASEQMSEAAKELKPGRWQNALPPEQKALQSLLRAESMFREIQVGFGQSGRGMGSGGAGRDLERLFDLELDTTKNQYETGESAASASAEQKALDQALQRLQMLANRQQELGAQRMQQQAFEQRWQEEQLRREAEQLRQEMEQLAQNGSNAASGQQSAAQQNALREAIRGLQQAEDQMRKAVSERGNAAQQRALDQLRKAQQLLSNAQHQQTGNSINELAQRAQHIAQNQREIANRVKQTYGSTGRSDRSTADRDSEGLQGSMPEMNDPRFGVRYGRQFWQHFESEPPSPAIGQEKAIADQKEKLARQLEGLERDMQEQSQNTAGTQPGTSSKLREALSEAQEKELALRMKKSAEWIRDGYGSRASGLEQSVTRGVERLSRQLGEAQQAFQAGNQAGQNEDAEARALANIRMLREQLQRSQERGANPQRSADAPQGGGGAAIADHAAIRESFQQLSDLRQQIDRTDRELREDLDKALRSLDRVSGAQPGLLESRISHEVLPNLERLEMDLNRRAGRKDGNARTAASEPAPEKYRDAVAEYFRRLSR
ncbi:MAG: hypothetical protein JOY62_15385 [Acidobacteriaceae bacterium]|nr:hypothetical protein [Acidobacteriaceae bacterium]MBV9781346.1 hypothetical protein [Acidobacteriaceae bacterium]